MLYSSAQIGNFPVKLYSLTILVSLDILLHHPARPLTKNSAVESFRREVNISPRSAFQCYRTLSGKSSTPDVEGASQHHWRKLTLVAFQNCAYDYGDADYGDDDLMSGCFAWERKIEASTSFEPDQICPLKLEQFSYFSFPERWEGLVMVERHFVIKAFLPKPIPIISSSQYGEGDIVYWNSVVKSQAFHLETDELATCRKLVRKKD